MTALELQPTQLPKQLEHPACKTSELLWMSFLLHIDQNTVTSIVPSMMHFFDYQRKHTFQALGVVKQLPDKKVGTDTILCLSGAYAGAICLNVASNNGWEAWSMNSSGITAAAVPLRMIRRAFIGNKYILQDLESTFNVTFSEERDSTENYVHKLLEVLKNVGWDHDPEQIAANTV